MSPDRDTDHAVSTVLTEPCQHGAHMDGRRPHALHSPGCRHDERNNKRFEEHDATPVEPDEVRRRATSRIDDARRWNKGSVLLKDGIKAVINEAR